MHGGHFCTSPISIHVLREEDDLDYDQLVAAIRISIHVLREEDDQISKPMNASTTNFNPRPPRGGRLAVFYKIVLALGISIHVLREEDDPLLSDTLTRSFLFQSTSSARRTTCSTSSLVPK